jgi:hypothetical protein
MKILKHIVNSWLFKRIVLNIVWLIISIIFLIVGSILMTKYLPDFIVIWYFIALAYGMAYRAIATMVFDALIGDLWSEDN